MIHKVYNLIVMWGRCVVGAFLNDRTIGEVVKRIELMSIEESAVSVFMDEKYKSLALPNRGPLRGTTMDTLQKKLIHVGLPADLAKDFKGYLRDGGAIAVVACDDYMIDDVVRLFNEAGAVSVEVAE